MNKQGRILARHYHNGAGVELDWKNGRIVSVDPAVAQGELWLAPPLTDLQVNGYAKVSFGSRKLTKEALLQAVNALHRDGCGQFFPTLCTDMWDAILEKLKRMRAWREEDAGLRATLAGWHIEGPFMSPEPGYRGAHSKDLMISPTPAHLHELRAAAGDDPILLTVAPERPGVLDMIPLATSLGIRVSLGHTNASATDIATAIQGGAVSFTHLGNGCPQELDRHNNILWRGIEATPLHIGLIPDSIHVSPALFRIMHRAVDPTRFWYTTDAVLPAGALPGKFQMEGGELEVGTDQIVRKPGATNFAGSALRPLEGIFRAAEMLGCSWRDVWDRYTVQPRRMMGLDTHQLAPNKPASFCLLDFTSPDAPTVTTYINGTPCSVLPARGWMRSAGIEA